MGEKFRELKDIFRLLETYHEAVESLGLATTFANKEKWEMLKSDNRAERAIHWGAAAAPWRILSGRIAGIPYHQLDGTQEARSEAAKILRDLNKQNYAKAIDEEMTRGASKILTGLLNRWPRRSSPCKRIYAGSSRFCPLQSRRPVKG